MKFIFLLYFLLYSNLAQCEQLSSQPARIPLNLALPKLETIANDAIIIGNGKNTIFVFVDPLCPRSVEFISLISSSTSMQSEYTYKIFLLSLAEHFDSASAIGQIYDSPNALSSMVNFMTKHVQSLGIHKISKQTQNKMAKISKIGVELNIYKRPYLFVLKAPKNITTSKGINNVL